MRSRMARAYARFSPTVEMGSVSPGDLAAVHDGGMAELFPFSFFDPVRGRWIRARYKATPEEIAARYERREITGGVEDLDSVFELTASVEFYVSGVAE
jgi:hypothetical protein